MSYHNGNNYYTEESEDEYPNEEMKNEYSNEEDECMHIFQLPNLKLYREGIKYSCSNCNNFTGYEETPEEILNALNLNIKEINKEDDFGSNSLDAVIYLGYHNMAITLINCGADLNHSSDCYGTALHNAAKCGQLSVVQELLKREPKLVNARNRKGDTPLMDLLCDNVTLNQEIIMCLLNADKLQINDRNSYGWNVLQCMEFHFYFDDNITLDEQEFISKFKRVAEEKG
jgi:ankyrin repeat protein